MLKNCLHRKSFLFFVWGSGRGVSDPFRSAEWGREGVDYAAERNGAGKGRALLWSGMAPVVLGLWLRPGTRGVRQAWCSVGRDAWGKLEFEVPGPGAGRCSVGQHALGRAG